MSVVLIVTDAESGAYQYITGVPALSKIPMCVITPQLAVAAGKSICAEFADAPPDSVVNAMVCRAYAPPLTSVPAAPVSVGSLVKRASLNGVVGAVGD